MRKPIASYAKPNGISHRLMLAVGLLAACGFAFVSIASNLRFGITLGSNPFDRIVYGVLSVAADLMKIALPMVAVILWRKGERMLAFAGAAFWIGTIAFSLCAAIGFAAASRGQTVALSENRIENRKAWEAKITRSEGRLDLLGKHRPPAVVQAEIEALLRVPGADTCQAINGPVTRDVCPKVDRLRQELVSSNEAERLEADLVADRRALSNLPVTATRSDPQSAALSRLSGSSEEAVRYAIAVLIAFLVELGSSLGFTVMIMSARPMAVRDEVATAPASPTVTKADSAPLASALLVEPDDLVTRWALDRLDLVSTGMIQAELAYRDFCEWCSSHNITTLTPQLFGRRFSKVHAGMGGKKVRRNGRAYYQGAVLQELTSSHKSASLRALTSC